MSRIEAETRAAQDAAAAAQAAAAQAQAQAAAAQAQAQAQAQAAAAQAQSQAAAAPAKVAADAAAATAAANAAKAKAELDMKNAYVDVSIGDKTALEKAQYFNFLKSQGKSESLIFEAIAYWVGPQTDEAIAALKTMADDLLKPKPIVSPKPPETPIFMPTTPITTPITPTAAGGANTGLVIAAALAALTLLG
jgi:multidrug efflux pump subunit AcrA (membrane-fusion protein)